MKDLLKDKLDIIANDDLLIKSLLALFEETIEEERPVITDNDRDDLIGQKQRAYDKSKKIISECFIKLSSLKNIKKADKSFNKGL